ncbi:NIPSNAP family protein, partial [Puia sp.]|uniref:NIPSNAP family protein n=1 Tax=Puia sp. TaxID=2045100 RepID=UPI002F414024
SNMDNTRGSKQQWYELRTYTFAENAQRDLTTAYLEKALLPALNRAGCTNIGVFSELPPQPTAPQPASAQPAAPQPAQPESAIAKIYLLIPFNSIDDFTGIAQKLTRDTAYTEAAAAYLDAPATAPAYQRIESSLFKAFAHMPVIEPPARKPRLFELRRYESPGEAAGQKKIEMFNDAGEIDIFKRVGARPVFFGEALIGQYRPNLTYMLTFDDMADHDARWKAFGSDPDWKTISKKPEYSDARLISKITRIFLTPAAFSQV